MRHRRMCENPHQRCPHLSKNNIGEIMDAQAKKYGNTVAISTVIIAALVACIFLWAKFKPDPVITVKYTHPHLLNTSVISKEGISRFMEVESSADILKSNKAYVYTEFCVDQPVLHGTISNLVSSSKAQVSLGTNPTSLSEGCFNASIPVILPNVLPQGDYTFSADLSGQLNLLKTFNTALYTLPVNLK